MLVGEAPGAEEAAIGRPFVGRSGEEQEWYLQHYGLVARRYFQTNVVKEFRPGNPDPTPAQIAEWTPHLLAEIAEVNPRVVVAVGRFATKWFLGDAAYMAMCHGIPHRAGMFDTGRADRGNGAIILPVIHPAAGLHDKKGETRSLIDWDYSQVAKVVKNGLHGTLSIPQDEYLDREAYMDVGGVELAELLSEGVPTVIGLDTEAASARLPPEVPWSIQISRAPGTGIILRTSRDDFADGIAAIQRIVDAGCVVAIHNAMFDVEVCRVFGLQLREARLWDTMYAAYLLRREPQGLKPLAWRQCGMRMSSYRETVGNAGLAKQIDYLVQVVAGTWGKPEQILIVENDNSARMKQPQRIERTAERILVDISNGKVDKDGELTDPEDRWSGIDKAVRVEVEGRLGAMPIGTLADIPLDTAVRYACRDADAALRVYHKLHREIHKFDLDRTMADGTAAFPVFEEMQATGIPASRQHFVDLAAEMDTEMFRLCEQLSHKYNGGRPINPKSPPQVGSLLRRRSLEPRKRTKTGMMSTSAESIEYLRFTDPAIALVFDWREHQHTRDSFCRPTIERIPEGAGSIYPVRCQIKTTRTTTRRAAARDPNLLAITTHGDHGRRIKDGFVCPEGEVFGAWDLQQIEMRVAAHESGDELMCRLFHEGRDIHDETASAIFDIPIAELDKSKHRVPAKRTGFGILYGQESVGLMIQLWKLGLTEWTEIRCAKLIRDWLALYEGVAEYRRQVAREVRETGYVRDCWGMYRYLPGIRHKDRAVASEAGRIAVSHRVQGGAQGMIQRSMGYLAPQILELQKAGLNVRWVLQTHDELMLRFDEELWDTVDGLVMTALTEHCGIELSVPVEAEGKMSRTWGGLK